MSRMLGLVVVLACCPRCLLGAGRVRPRRRARPTTERRRPQLRRTGSTGSDALGRPCRAPTRPRGFDAWSLHVSAAGTRRALSPGSGPERTSGGSSPTQSQRGRPARRGERARASRQDDRDGLARRPRQRRAYADSADQAAQALPRRVRHRRCKKTGPRRYSPATAEGASCIGCPSPVGGARRCDGSSTTSSTTSSPSAAVPGGHCRACAEVAMSPTSSGWPATRRPTAAFHTCRGACCGVSGEPGNGGAILAPPALPWSDGRRIQIKHVPEETHAVLTRRAAAAHQSLQEYLLAKLIEDAAHPDERRDLRRDRARVRARGRRPQLVLQEIADIDPRGP